MRPSLNRGYLRVFGVIGAVLFGSGELSAQSRFGPQPVQPFNPQASRPVVSPYLNLLRPGGSAAFNYFTLVRPQLEFQQSINTIQSEVLQNRQALTTLGQANTAAASGIEDLPPTANVPAFLNTAGYFSGGSSIRSNSRSGRGIGGFNGTSGVSNGSGRNFGGAPSGVGGGFGKSNTGNTPPRTR